MEENNFKEGMLDAIYILNKLSKDKMTWDEELIVRLKQRSSYIERKLESCAGYSKLEKSARKDEIKNTIEIVEKLAKRVNIENDSFSWEPDDEL